MAVLPCWRPVRVERKRPLSRHVFRTCQPGYGMELGDQADGCLIRSPWLKGIASPDRPAALRFLGNMYNNLMEKYKQLVSKCAKEYAPRFDGLKKKYVANCAEWRRLYNELIEMRGNIRVFCQCWPLSGNEISRGCSSVV
ncbi:hypothetical protein ACQ4PT_026863 [Festuca glaucescens]